MGENRYSCETKLAVVKDQTSGLLTTKEIIEKHRSFVADHSGKRNIFH